MKQSKKLTKFYKDYQEWLKQGAPDGHPFWRDNGLCHSAYLYAGGAYYTGPSLTVEMAGQFSKAGLDACYPFGEAAFNRATRKNTMHLSRKRRAWVKAHTL